MRSEADSASGEAIVTNVAQTTGRVQVSLLRASGSGTVTVSVRPGTKVDGYEAVEDGTIDVSSPTTIIIDGDVNAVKAASDNSGDSFTLEVIG